VANKPRAWLTPSATLPLGTACYVLAVPDNEDFRRMLVGALGLLTNPDNFEKFGTLTPEETANAWKQTKDSLIFRESECSMIGSIIPYATATPPPKMLACDGSAYLRVDYPRLYDALIGTSLIVNANFFSVPFLDGRILRGMDANNPINSYGGNDELTIGIDNMPSHSHNYEGVIPNIDLELAGVPDVFGAGINPFPTPTSNVGGGVPIVHVPSFYSISYGMVWG